MISVSEVTAEEAELDYNELSVGNIFIFGKYEQDNNLENGPECIEWIVLDVEEGRALLISKYGLDALQFHNKETSWGNPVNWRMSSIRKWLNQEFYENAFSEGEKNSILPMNLDDSSDISEDLQSEPQKDRIIILSVDEVRQYMNKEIRSCQATPYAISKKIWTGYDGNCWWWLRTPGEEHNYITHVGTEGDLHIYGNRATEKDGTVRPALWLKLKDE